MRKILIGAILLCITLNMTAQTTEDVMNLGAGFVVDAAWSSDGTQFAVSTDNFLLLYDASLTLLEQTIDANTGEALSFLNGVEREHDGATSPDGIITATFSTESIEITSSARNPGDFTIEAAEGTFDTVVWSPDSRYLAAIGEESYPNVLVANTQTGDVVLQALIDQPGNIRDVLFQPQGDRVVFTTAFSDIFLYDLTSGEQIAQRWLMAGGGSISLHPDGVRLAVATERSQDVYIWNAVTGEEMHLFQSPNDHTQYNFLYSVAWSPDGRYLATGGIGGGEDDMSGPIDLFVWDAEIGEVIQRIPALSYAFTTINEINWSADSTMLAWSTTPDQNGSYIGAWRVTDETLIYQQALEVGVNDIALNPAGTQLSMIAYNYDNDIPVTLETVDLITGDFLEPVDLQTIDNRLSIDWHPDGRHIALLQQVYEDGGYGRIIIFDRETNTSFSASITEQVSLTLMPYLAWSADGMRLAMPFRVADETDLNVATNGALVYDVALETEEITLHGRYERDYQLGYGPGNGALSWAADGTMLALSAAWEELMLVKIEP